MTSTNLPKIALAITTEWQLFGECSPAVLYELLRFRQQIFVVEQRSPYPDLDGNDVSARHLLLRAEGLLAGYLRLLPPTAASGSIRIGRLAVAAHLRRHGLGRRLMAEALSFWRLHYPNQSIVLSAQLQLVRFYENFGFVGTGAPFDDFGVAHVEMTMAPAR
jgi:ElaA protein